jgi:hypothetical protein
MATVRFFVSGSRNSESFTLNVPSEWIEACYALPKEDGGPGDRLRFWREKTGDARFIGHAMVWEPYSEPPISNVTSHPW